MLSVKRRAWIQNFVAPRSRNAGMYQLLEECSFKRVVSTYGSVRICGEQSGTVKGFFGFHLSISFHRYSWFTHVSSGGWATDPLATQSHTDSLPPPPQVLTNAYGSITYRKQTWNTHVIHQLVSVHHIHPALLLDDCWHDCHRALMDEQDFPCRYNSTMALQAHVSHGGWTIPQLVAAVRRRSLTPPHYHNYHIDNNN
jgi:hypothetical protein